MCRNINSTINHQHCTSDLLCLVVSSKEKYNLDTLSDKVESLKLSDDFKSHSRPETSGRSSNANVFWKLRSTSSDSDLYLNSETCSESCTDQELDSDTTQIIRDELIKINSALYGDESFEGLDESVLEECRLFSESFPHIRVTGHRCKLEKIETDNDNTFEEEEEVFVSHYNISETVDGESSSTPLIFEEEVAGHSSTNEKLDECMQNLFNQFWPEVQQILRPPEITTSLESLFLTHDDDGIEDSNLSSCSAEKSKRYLPTSPNHQRSKSSRDIVCKSPESLLFVEGEKCTLSRNPSRTSNPSGKRRQVDKTSTSIVLPPTVKTGLAMARSQRGTGRTHAVSAKVNPTTNNSHHCGPNFRFNTDAKAVVPPHNKTRHGLLPPLDNLPDLYHKNTRTRSNSAMIRYKTTPNQPLATRNRTLLTPIELKKTASHSRRKADPLKDWPEQALGYNDNFPTELRHMKKIKPKLIPWK